RSSQTTTNPHQHPTRNPHPHNPIPALLESVREPSSPEAPAPQPCPPETPHPPRDAQPDPPFPPYSNESSSGSKSPGATDTDAHRSSSPDTSALSHQPRANQDTESRLT